MASRLFRVLKIGANVGLRGGLEMSDAWAPEEALARALDMAGSVDDVGGVVERGATGGMGGVERDAGGA
jgi:hypothetical protein